MNQVANIANKKLIEAEQDEKRHKEAEYRFKDEAQKAVQRLVEGKHHCGTVMAKLVAREFIYEIQDIVDQVDIEYGIIKKKVAYREWTADFNTLDVVVIKSQGHWVANVGDWDTLYKVVNGERVTMTDAAKAFLDEGAGL